MLKFIIYFLICIHIYHSDTKYNFGTNDSPMPLFCSDETKIITFITFTYYTIFKLLFFSKSVWKLKI